MISKSVEDTQKFAFDLAKSAHGGEIFALSGDLGGGKTTFTQGFAKGLGIKESVNSPTFVLIKEYDIGKFQIPNSKSQINSKFQKSKPEKLIHIDLYRLKKIDKIFLKEIQEYFTHRNIVIIEWAEKIKNILPPQTKWLKFEFVDENTRNIILK